MADQLSREGRGRDWRLVDCLLVATSHLNQILQTQAPQSHRNGHAGRRLETCDLSGACARRQASYHGERRTRAPLQGASARDVVEKGRKGSDAKEKSQAKGKQSDKGEGRRISSTSHKESQATRARLSSLGDSAVESDLHPLVKPWLVSTRWRARLYLMLAFQKVSTPHPCWGGHWWALVLAPSGVQNHSFLWTAPSYCQSVAPQNRPRG